MVQHLISTGKNFQINATDIRQIRTPQNITGFFLANSC
jgi:hypothetical protein